MSGPRQPRFLPDANAVINLLRDGVKARALTQLCQNNEMKVVDAVARELERRDGRAKTWVGANRAFQLTPNQAILTEMARVAVQYKSILTVSTTSADPMLVATACHYRAANPSWVVITDDAGVQLACFLEQLRFLPMKAFRRLRGL